MKARGDLALFDPLILRQSVWPAFTKLNPVTLVRNPIMFVVEIISILATALFIFELWDGQPHSATQAQVTVWLWITVLFGNFAEAVAERRGRARADSLRATQQETEAKRLRSARGMDYDICRSGDLRTGDFVLCAMGDIIPADGEVIEGIASVDESPITGESACVIRESGGDRSGVTGGTKIVSDWLKVRVTVREGGSFLDRMIAMVEGAKRQKTPSEIALTILLVGQTVVFLIVVAALGPFALYSGVVVPITFLLALLVTLIPTTIGALLSAIGIAGMDRLVKANVIAKSGRAVEACGDVDTLLLDKTGTITFGNRMAVDLKPLPGVQMRELTETAYLASLSDATPEGKSIVELARRRFENLAEGAQVARSIPFSAETRISGADLSPQGEVRKGAEDAIRAYAKLPDNDQLTRIVQDIARSGGTPIVVAKDRRVLGVIHLKDVVKPDIRDRFQQLRKMGVRTVMITGDNPLTAAAIAAEAGVDDFIAEATPEKKLVLIRKLQGEGRVVAMCGDGSNDAPALAQADVGVAMNDGTQAAKEAANLVDLDSDPTKLIEVVRVGKQLLISRGSLTTFSIANDVAKYFTILPPLFATVYPGLDALNIMGLHSPQSAILSAVIFNALIIVALIPLALKGVNYEPSSAEALLSRNLTIYGLGGIVVPFLGIKAIDLAVVGLGLV
ncbi:MULTISPECIES: potassium-transporting ATPase subunit KdpB [Rhodomicrobium]|uniref:potassium-transporting ATPase subunit KdpB n=1 Tax=Rhodomicrobium TaxID=1068 RepID=UPI000B4AC7DA|nr:MULTISPECIES: potassium-transporting ATPase subunit KdpB [Rhodomicrobium]